MQTGKSQLLFKVLKPLLLKDNLDWRISLTIMMSFCNNWTLSWEHCFSNNSQSQLTTQESSVRGCAPAVHPHLQITHVHDFLFHYQLVCSTICKNEHIPCVASFCFCTSISGTGCSCSRRKQCLSLLLYVHTHTHTHSPPVLPYQRKAGHPLG